MNKRIFAFLKEKLARIDGIDALICQILDNEEFGEQLRQERSRQRALKSREERIRKKGLRLIGGIDEAGRGPLAGPVVAACVVFDDIPFIPYVNDSKQLRANERELLCEWIKGACRDSALGIVGPEEIDRINIHNASLEAMRLAVKTLKAFPDFIFVDGLFPVPSIDTEQRSLVKGDEKCFSIACASIIAKVARDAIMCGYDESYPQYGFKDHKGYGTRKHIEALRLYGCSPLHRISYAPVRECMAHSKGPRIRSEQLTLLT